MKRNGIFHIDNTDVYHEINPHFKCIHAEILTGNVEGVIKNVNPPWPVSPQKPGDLDTRGHLLPLPGSV